MTVAATALLALAGCSDADAGPSGPSPSASSATSSASPGPSSADPSAPADDAGPALLLEDGLGLVDPLTGSVSRAVLGGPVDAALTVGLAAFGAPPQLDPTACELDERDSWVWADGLVVHARDGAFIGWTVRPGSPATALTTPAGIGIGSTAAELQAAYGVAAETTSLGEEFALGRLSGVLDAAGEGGRVVAVWGGDGCVAR